MNDSFLDKISNLNAVYNVCKPSWMKLFESLSFTSARAEKSRFGEGPKGAALRVVRSSLPFSM